MRQREMTRLINGLSKLTHHQRQQLEAALAALSARTLASQVIETRVAAAPICPHCSSTAIVKNGSANGLQRYKCRQCARTFNALSGTPLARLHLRGKWVAHVQALGQSLSLNQVARKLDIAQSTAFRWRHRFLACPRTMQPAALVGIAEADESYFLISAKGRRGLLRKARRRGGKASQRGVSKEQVAVLMARDRAGATAHWMLATRRAADVQAALAPLLSVDTVLCTDASPTLAAAARALGVQHQAVNLRAGVRVRGPWHVQNVNAYVSGLRVWLLRFKGVATRYLDSYLGWFRMLERTHKDRPQPASMLALAIGA